MQISDEQYKQVGRAIIALVPTTTTSDVGRTAVAAVAPLLLAEPTEDEKRQMATDFAAAANVEGTSGWDNFYHALRNMNANRLASVTAKPNPAVEAVKVFAPQVYLGRDNTTELINNWAEHVVAAVDASRAK